MGALILVLVWSLTQTLLARAGTKSDSCAGLGEVCPSQSALWIPG